MAGQLIQDNLLKTFLFLYWVTLSPFSKISCTFVCVCITELNLFFYWPFIYVMECHTDLITVGLQQVELILQHLPLLKVVLDILNT